MATRSITYSDAKIVELWLQNRASPHTQGCYRRDSARLLAHVAKPLARVTLADLHSFGQALATAGLAPISRARTLAAVKSLFGFLFRMRLVPINFAAELPLPRYEVRLAERILSEQDTQRLLAVEAADRDRILLKLLYLTGLRVSEATGLRWRNLHSRGDTGQLTVYGKGGRTRAVTLPSALWSELMALRGAAGAEDPVFRSRTGKSLDRGFVRRILRKVAAEAGIPAPISPHWLRHAHATHALAAGAPLSLIQNTLGHSSISTTAAYLHVLPNDSSTRFLLAETFLPKSVKSALSSKRTGVMDVLTAVPTAEGEQIMTSNTEDQAKTEAATGPKATQKARVAQHGAPVATGKGKAGKNATPAKKGASSPKGGKKAKGGREGSKTARVLELLKRPGGATATELQKATGWQPHSVRGFLSGTVGKKMGLAINSAKGEDGERSYSVKG